MIALTGQRSTLRRLRRPANDVVAERGAGNKCRSGGRRVSSSGDWDLGNPAFAISHGSRDTTTPTPGLTIALLACCCSFHLSDPGKPLDPRTLLRVPPGCTGDTTERLAAHFASRPSCSRQGVGPSSRSAYRPTAGPRRGYRVPHERAATGMGAPYTPGTAVLLPVWGTCSTGACRSTAASPCTPPTIPSARAPITRHQRGFKQFTG